MTYRAPRWIFVVLVCWCTLQPSSLKAQISGALLSETQVGNIPDTEPTDLTSTYSQLNLRYRQGNLTLAMRGEQFVSRFEARNYTRASQYRLAYRADNLEVQAGHFYDIVGRGLLLRAYEIPGTILEDQGARVRQGFYRDLFGVGVKGRFGKWQIKGIKAQVLANDLPANMEPEDRRPDLVEALEVRFRPGRVEVGGAYMRNNRADEYDEYATVFMQAALGGAWTFYGELAQQLGPDNPLLAFDGPLRVFGTYAAATYSAGSFSLSAEYKQYRNFLLASGLNDPPAGIREHSYVVLNRSTHILNPFDESGWQLEGFYVFSTGALLTVNLTLATNDPSGDDYHYREVFAEYSWPVSSAVSVKAFVDVSQDPFNLEDERYAGGAAADVMVGTASSVSATVEVQQIERVFRDPAGVPIVEETLHNVVLRGAYAWRNVSVATVVEVTTDPLIVDRADTFEQETGNRWYGGGAVSYTYRNRHYVSLFVGSRRGGPACTGGICYEVLDFRGAEVRFTTKF